jgi:hypothetical protein
MYEPPQPFRKLAPVFLAVKSASTHQNPPGIKANKPERLKHLMPFSTRGQKLIIPPEQKYAPVPHFMHRYIMDCFLHFSLQTLNAYHVSSACVYFI